MEISDPFYKLFQQEATRNGVVIDSLTQDGLIYIDGYQISLDNARKDFAINGNTNKIHELIRLVLSHSDKIPSWKDASLTLLPILVPADMDVHNIIHKSVTDSMNMVLVRNVGDRIIWVQQDNVSVWQQDERKIIDTGYANLDAMLSKSEIKPAILDGHSYGIVLGTESFLDASIPLAPAFKRRVEKQFGWPVYVVMPVRDLCFIFSEHEFNFFSERLSTTVLEEFRTSPYPVTRELLKISDVGIETVGHYNSTKKELP